jgi:UDP-N-acetylmuramate dehydrogenase
MIWRENISLRPFNTFGMDAVARYFHAFRSADELMEGISGESDLDGMQHMVLGGGSNMLFTRNYDGLILKNEIPGIELKGEDENSVLIKAGAGENWHAFVMQTLEKGWSGLENLALIPGTVGASPLQNIGAYGVEVKDRIVEVEALDLLSRSSISFSNSDCGFGYRDSVFKKKNKGRYAILSVSFRLFKKDQLNLDYGAIRQELESMDVQEPDALAVAKAVMRIRKAKLPDPAVIGNAGSFFKNPLVEDSLFQKLKLRYPDLVAYPSASGEYKLAAGWLMERAGWKGYRDGDAGCHPSQALVLVNYGNAKGSDILNLCNRIKTDVKEKFGVLLEEEVNIY